MIVAHKILPVLAARVLEAFRHGRHGSVMHRWDGRVHFGNSLGGRIVELKYAPGHWVRWNGRIYRVSRIGQLIS